MQGKNAKQTKPQSTNVIFNKAFKIISSKTN